MLVDCWVLYWIRLQAEGNSVEDINNMLFSTVISTFVSSRAHDSSSTLPAVSMQSQLASVQRQLQPEVVTQPLEERSPSAITFTSLEPKKVVFHTQTAVSDTSVQKASEVKQDKAAKKKSKPLSKKPVTQ